MTKTISNVKSILATICIAGSCLTVSAQNFDWAKKMGGAGVEYSHGIAIDNGGNTYIGGTFTSTIADFNPGGSGGVLNNNTAGNFMNDVFLAKYDVAGNFLWAKNTGGKGFDQGYNITVDGNGDIYITGAFNSDTAYFNRGGSGGILPRIGSGSNGFLAKYDGSGNFLWAKNMGGNGSCLGMGLTTDNNGNVYLTGYLSDGPIDFNPGGSGGSLPSRGSFDAFLAKYDGSGSFLWVKGMGAGGNDQGWSVAVDGNGNAYVTGFFSEQGAFFDFYNNIGALTSAGRSDVFLAKYDPAGNFLWSKGMGGKDDDKGYGIAADSSGNIYATGTFSSDTTYFNPGGSGGILTRAGSEDVFLAKYDVSGNYLWAKSMGGTGSDHGNGIAVDTRGNVYVTGSFDSDTAHFNPGGSGGKLATVGNRDIFLAKYNTEGKYLWTKSMGGSKIDVGRSVTVGGNGNVYVTGQFTSTPADFNIGGSGDTLTSVGFYDAFAMKFSCKDTFLFYLRDSTVCGGSYTWYGKTYTTEGIYTEVFSKVNGCDSTIILDLTFIPIDKPVITTNSFTLGVTGKYATYQWILNGIAIDAATDSVYTVKENGNYQVMVTNENGCSDTSYTYTVANYTGIENVSVLSDQIHIYPNPATDVVYIQSPVKTNIRITDIAGKVIKDQNDVTSVFIGELTGGVYFLNITDEDGVMLKVEKLVKAE